MLSNKKIQPVFTLNYVPQKRSEGHKCMCIVICFTVMHSLVVLLQSLQIEQKDKLNCTCVPTHTHTLGIGPNALPLNYIPSPLKIFFPL